MMMNYHFWINYPVKYHTFIWQYVQLACEKYTMHFLNKMFIWSVKTVHWITNRPIFAYLCVFTMYLNPSSWCCGLDMLSHMNTVEKVCSVLATGKSRKSFAVHVCFGTTSLGLPRKAVNSLGNFFIKGPWNANHLNYPHPSTNTRTHTVHINGCVFASEFI